MATSVLPFTVTISADTAKTSPVTTDLDLGTNVVEKVRWRVPAGPNGTMGWYLAMGGIQVIPYATGEYIVANDEGDDWQVDGLPDTGAWQLVGYNAGNFDHTVYLWFFVHPVQLDATSPGVAPIPASQLTG